MFGTSKRNVWRSLGAASVVAVLAAWLFAPSNLAAPAGEALARTMGGACFVPGFNCAQSDSCANNTSKGSSQYYDYWSGVGIGTDVLSPCVIVRDYLNDLNCPGSGDQSTPYFRCS